MAKTSKAAVLGLYVLVLVICCVGINGFMQAVNARPNGDWLRPDHLANSFVPMAILSALALWFQLRRQVDWWVLAGFAVAGVLLFLSVVNHAFPERAAPFAIAHVAAAVAVILLTVLRVRKTST